MASYIIQDTTLTAIADSIRAKTGTTDPIKVSAMADAITSIEAGSGGGGTKYHIDYIFEYDHCYSEDVNIVEVFKPTEIYAGGSAVYLVNYGYEFAPTLTVSGCEYKIVANFNADIPERAVALFNPTGDVTIKIIFYG